MSTGPGRARNGGDDNEVCDVRPQQRRERIVEVALRFIGVAKRAFCHNIRAKLQIQQPALQVDELGPQDIIRRRQIATCAHPIEQHIDGDLKPRVAEDKEVLGAPKGQCLDEVCEGEEAEEAEGEADGRGEWLDLEALGARWIAEGAVVGDGFGDEDWADEEGEGADAGRLMVSMLMSWRKGEDVRVPGNCHGCDAR